MRHVHTLEMRKNTKKEGRKRGSGGGRKEGRRKKTNSTALGKYKKVQKKDTSQITLRYK